MKSIVTSAILSIAALSSCSLAVVTMSFSKNPAPGFKVSSRALAKRKDFDAQLDHEINSIVNSNYMISLQVGTPPQDIDVAIDTGSSDVWVLDSSVALCTDEGATTRAPCRTPFTHEDSSTFEVTYPDSFDITYGDGTSAQGDYFADTIRFGGEAIKSQTMGIAYNSTLSPGLLGLGYTTNEASVAQEPPFTYPSIVDNMFNDGLISVKAYSLYLDDLHSSTGSLLFGGLDSDKYQGNLVQMPIVPYGTTRNGNAYYTAFDVNMVSLGVTKGSGKSTKFGTGDYNIATNLDSGTTLSYVPSSLFDAILEEFGGEEDAGSGLAFIPCSVRDNKELTFDFELGEDKTIVIKVPAAEMIYDSGPILDSYEPSISIDDACILGFISQPGGPYLLGDNFLRSAYVVYDLQNNFIAVGQTNFDSTTSSIVDFPADATEIPMKSGVATSPVREPSHESTGPATTANSGSQTTANGGSRTAANGGIDTRSANDSPGSPQPTGDDNKNPAVAPRPLELGGLAVLGVSMMFTLVGGGLFLVY